MSVEKTRSSTSSRTNAAVLFGTVLALLVSAEVVLRLVYHPSIVRSFIRYDPLLGWSLIPGASIKDIVPEIAVENVVTLFARQMVVSSAAKQRIVAGAPIERIVTG